MIIVMSSCLKCFPLTLKRKPAFSNSSCLKSVFEKLRFRDGSSWAVSLTVEKLLKAFHQIHIPHSHYLLRWRFTLNSLPMQENSDYSHIQCKQEKLGSFSKFYPATSCVYQPLFGKMSPRFSPRTVKLFPSGKTFDQPQCSGGFVRNQTLVAKTSVLYSQTRTYDYTASCGLASPWP